MSFESVLAILETEEELATFCTTMSGLGRYPLNIPSLSDAFLGSNQRRDRLDYDDRRYRERERDRRDDDYRRDSSGSRGRSSRDRYSPEVSYVVSGVAFSRKIT